MIKKIIELNNNSKHTSHMGSNKRGLIEITKSFKEVLNDELNKSQVEIDTVDTRKPGDIKAALSWQADIHENSLKLRGNYNG